MVLLSLIVQLQEGNTYNWNILQTKIGQEQKVSLNLMHKRIEHYCPLVRTTVHSVRSKNYKLVPLFPSYVFVYVDKMLLSKAMKVKGVLNCMYWLNNPAVVSYEEIKVIRELLDENTHFKLLHSRVEHQGTIMTPFYTNSFSENKHVSDHFHQVKVNLPSLGCCLSGEVRSSFKLFNVANGRLA